MGEMEVDSKTGKGTVESGAVHRLGGKGKHNSLCYQTSRTAFFALYSLWTSDRIGRSIVFYTHQTQTVGMER